ncbi:MAG: crotonase, partial [Myxococcota bacterium]
SAAAYEQEVFGMCFSTADQKEGMAAFLDKRKPNWQG